MKALQFCMVVVFGAVLTSGCATTASAPVESGSNCNPIILCKDFIAKTENLGSQVEKLKEENHDLRKEIDEMSKLQVRMPNGKEIQNALKNAGFYKGPIDGQIGSKTKEAIKKFQEANKLPVDGVIGSKTWNLLYKFLGMPSAGEQDLK